MQTSLEIIQLIYVLLEIMPIFSSYFYSMGSSLTLKIQEGIRSKSYRQIKVFWIQRRSGLKRMYVLVLIHHSKSRKLSIGAGSAETSSKRKISISNGCSKIRHRLNRIILMVDAHLAGIPQLFTQRISKKPSKKGTNNTSPPQSNPKSLLASNSK